MYNLERFKTAQEKDYPKALGEIKKGQKLSHWIWYIFPQLKELGRSDTAKYYGIKDMEEAAAYFADPLLRSRLIEISTTLLPHQGKSAPEIMGHPDDLKLCSCMTLFAALENTDPVFGKVLDKYYGGKRDTNTLELIRMT